jgi:hypothetical protein
MIQIACLYCGKKLTAKDEWVGRNVQCPECNHIFHIPKKRLGEDEYKPRSAVKNDEHFWDGKSNEEIAEVLLTTEEQREKRKLAFLIPRYDDLTLFTLSVTSLLLLLISGQLQEDIGRLITARDFDPRLYLYGIPFLLGMLLSFVNAFLRREKSDFEKILILVFAVGVTAGTGLYAGEMMRKDHEGWMLIFPFWNIANAGILLALCRTGFVTTECVTDEDASYWQMAYSIIVISALLALCNYVFKLHWVYTYSIAVCYTMSLQGVLQDFFPKIMKN